MRIRNVLWLAFTLCLSVLSARAEEGEEKTFSLEAGPIWNNDHAKERCPEVLAEWLAANPGKQARWTGHWNTTVPNEMSVCHCEFVDETKNRAKWDGKVRFIFRNKLPTDIWQVTIDADDGAVSSGPETNALPGQSLTVTVDAASAMQSIVFDAGVAEFRFDDLSELPELAEIELTVEMDRNEDVYLEGTGDYRNLRIPGKVSMLINDDDRSKRLDFREAIDAGSIAAIREAYNGEMKKAKSGFIAWLEFAGDPWSAFLVPDGYDSDSVDEDTAGADTITMISPNHYADLGDAMDEMRKMGFRPWRAWINLELGENDSLKNLDSDEYDVENLDGEDADEVWEEVRREVVEEREPGETPWVINVLFVTEKTYRELKDGAEPTSQPIFLIRRDNTIFSQMTYIKDGLSMIKMASK